MDEVGAMARSLAGHDKDEIFVITKEEGEYVSLVDGGLKPLAKPKRKNKKHIQIIRDREKEMRKQLIHDQMLTDDKVRAFIRRCKRESQV